MSGSLPIEVAHSSGYIEIAVALLRHAAPGSEHITDYGALLDDYISELSDSFACAGWLSEIEFALWCLVSGQELPIEDIYNFRSLTKDDLDGLRFLSDKSQSWPYWDEREQRVCLVSLTRWQYLYDEWYEKKSQKRAS